MKYKFAAVCFVLFVAVSSITAYAQDKSILKLADEYSLALKKYQKQKSRKSVESVMRKGKALDEKLLEMEDLSEADYALLKKKMKGFVINREEIVFIKPDLKFFQKLSRTRGTKADIAFFTLMREIRPDDVWAAYIEPQTDVTGCTIYGNGVLTKLYGKAVQFKRNYPKSYVSDINEEISEILQEFGDAVCACGEREDVLKEYRLFIKTFPSDKNTPAIKQNLEKIEKSVDARFNCQSG